MPLEPPTRRVPFLWKNRPTARFLGCSNQVIFRLLPFQSGGQVLVDFHGGVCGAARDTNLKYCPISDIQQQKDTDEYRKVPEQPPEPTPDHEVNPMRAKVSALPNSHARIATRTRLSRDMLASYGIFFIIGEQSYLVSLFPSLSLGNSM
jgi:hypothetical protein